MSSNLAQLSDKNRISLYNALSAFGLTLCNGLLGIISTHFIITYFGSDFNGLNSTANQIVNILLLLEGGFTLASNVALFSPVTQNDYKTINGILVATRQKFHQIGYVFLALGVIASLVFAKIVNSALTKPFIISITLMTVIPTAFNLYYATIYKVLLQAQQKEYIINFITMLTVSGGHIANIIAIIFGCPMWTVRFITMFFALVNSIFIADFVKRKNVFLDLKIEPRIDLITGTGDVLAQKITGVVYNSAPIVFLAISPIGGTMLASVYAVYNSVLVMIKSLLHAIIDAPRLSFGQMLAEHDKEYIWPIFAQYEYIAFLAIFVLLTTTYKLILPFVRLYTNGINDIKYEDALIALLMVLTSSVEMFHIPSGHLINMAGKFRISRNFQVLVCIILVLLMLLGGNVWGVYGMLGAILVAAILLAVLETGYVHVFLFRGKIGQLVRRIVPLLIAGICVCETERFVTMKVESYASFMLYGVVLVLFNSLVAIVVSILFNREELELILRRCEGLIVRN